MTQTPVLLHGSIQFDIPSKISGRTYRIFVFKPTAPPPPPGYPVIVVTDGNMMFPLAATLDAAFELRGGRSALVVGVGYYTDDYLTPLRLRNDDLTPPGSENFYRFLTEELQPAIAGAWPADPDDQTLYGHSLGGMFALGVLFNHPESFRSFVASSPSIWWNERALLNDVPAFACKVEAGEVAPRVLILVGAGEQTEQTTDGSRMVDNARELAARLQQIDGKSGYTVRFHAFEDEDHLTSLPAAIGRALAFAVRPQAG